MPDVTWTNTTFYNPPTDTNPNSSNYISDISLKPREIMNVVGLGLEDGLHVVYPKKEKRTEIQNNSKGCKPYFGWDWKCGSSDTIYSSHEHTIPELRSFDETSQSLSIAAERWKVGWEGNMSIATNQNPPSGLQLDCVKQTRKCAVRLHLDDFGVLTIKRLIPGEDIDEVVWKSHTSRRHWPRTAVPHPTYITSNRDIKNVGRPRPFTVEERLSLTSNDSGVIMPVQKTNSIKYYMYGEYIEYGSVFITINPNNIRNVDKKTFYIIEDKGFTKIVLREPGLQDVAKYYKGGIDTFDVLKWDTYNPMINNGYQVKDSNTYHIGGPSVGAPRGNKQKQVTKTVIMPNQTVYMIDDDNFTKMVAIRHINKQPIAKYYRGTPDNFNQDKWDTYNLVDNWNYVLHPPSIQPVSDSENIEAASKKKRIEDAEARGRSFLFANEEIKKGDWLSSPGGMCRLTLNDNNELVVEYYESKCTDLKFTDVSDVHSMDIKLNPSKIGKMGYINNEGKLKEWPSASENATGHRFGSTYWGTRISTEPEDVNEYTYFDGFILGNTNALYSAGALTAKDMSGCETWCTSDKLCAAYSFNEQESDPKLKCNIVSLPPGVTTMDTIYNDKGKYAVRLKKVVGGDSSVPNYVTKDNAVSNTFWNSFINSGFKRADMTKTTIGGLAAYTKQQEDAYQGVTSASNPPTQNATEGFVTDDLKRKINVVADLNRDLDAPDLASLKNGYSNALAEYNLNVNDVITTQNNIHTNLNTYGEVKNELNTMNPEVTKQLIAMEDEKQLHLKSVKTRFLLWRIGIYVAIIVIFISFFAYIFIKFRGSTKDIPVSA